MHIVKVHPRDIIFLNIFKMTRVKHLLKNTRWHHRYASFKAIKDSYTALQIFLTIQDDELITICRATASGLLKKISSFKFIFENESLLQCFKAVNFLNETAEY